MYAINVSLPYTVYNKLITMYDFYLLKINDYTRINIMLDYNIINKFKITIIDDNYIFIDNDITYFKPLIDKERIYDFNIFYKYDDISTKIGLNSNYPILYIEGSTGYILYNSSKYYINNTNKLVFTDINILSTSVYFIHEDTYTNYYNNLELSEKDYLHNILIKKKIEYKNIYKYKSFLIILDNFYIEYNDEIIINNEYKLIISDQYDELPYNIKYFMNNKYSDML